MLRLLPWLPPPLPLLLLLSPPRRTRPSGPESSQLKCFPVSLAMLVAAGAILASAVMFVGLREDLAAPGAVNMTTTVAAVPLPLPPPTTAMLLLLVVSIFLSGNSISSAEVVDTRNKLTKTENDRNTKTGCR